MKLKNKNNETCWSKTHQAQAEKKGICGLLDKHRSGRPRKDALKIVG